MTERLRRSLAVLLCALTALGPSAASAQTAAAVVEAPAGAPVVFAPAPLTSLSLPAPLFSPSLAILPSLASAASLSSLSAVVTAASALRPSAARSSTAHAGGRLGWGAAAARRFSSVTSSPLLTPDPKLPSSSEGARDLGDDLLRRMTGEVVPPVVSLDELGPRRSGLGINETWGLQPRAPFSPDELGGPGGGPSGPVRPPDSPRGLGERIKAWFRLVPDSTRSGLLWVYLLGAAAYNLGSQFYQVALPGLIPDKRQLGMARTAHWTVTAGASFLSGPWIDSSSNRKMLLWTGFAQAAAVGLIPAFHFLGLGWGFTSVLTVLIVRAALQMVNMNAGQVAFTKLMGKDQQAFNKVNAISMLLYGLVGMGGSYGAAWLLNRFHGGAGAQTGVAMAFLAYFVLAAGSNLYYYFKLKSKDLAVPGRVEPQAPPVGSLKSRILGFLGQRLRDYRRGIRLVFKEKPFVGWSLLLMTLEIVALDALTYIVLPGHLASIGGGPGSLGDLMAMSALGTTLASLAMMFWDRGKRSEEEAARRLERQGRLTYFLAALGSAAFLGVALAPTVAVASGFYLLMNLLTYPLSIVWSSLVQKHLESDRENMGKGYAFIGAYVPMFSGVGTFLSGLALGKISPHAALLLFTGLMLADALLHVLGGFVLFPSDKGAPKRDAPRPEPPPRLSMLFPTAGLAYA